LPSHNDPVHAAPRWSKIARLLTCRVNMTQIQVGSPEQRLARWMIYAVLAAPLVATLLHDLGVGAVGPWIIYAILVAPMIVMLSHREIDIDPLIRWVLYVIIAIAPVLFWSPGG
jgi:hypothetical protein